MFAGSKSAKPKKAVTKKAAKKRMPVAKKAAKKPVAKKAAKKAVAKKSVAKKAPVDKKPVAKPAPPKKYRAGFMGKKVSNVPTKGPRKPNILEVLLLGKKDSSGRRVTLAEASMPAYLPAASRGAQALNEKRKAAVLAKTRGTFRAQKAGEDRYKQELRQREQKVAAAKLAQRRAAYLEQVKSKNLAAQIERKREAARKAGKTFVG